MEEKENTIQSQVQTVTARVWCRGGIDRKKNSTINLTTAYGACFYCLHINLSSHTGRHNKQLFYSAAGNAKIYLKNYNNYIIPRLTLLIETFIHMYNHSFTVLFSKSINTMFFTSLETFSFTSWTLLFLAHFLFFWDLISLLFLWASLILLQFVGLHPTVTTGLISGRACLGVPAIKSAALMSPPPRVNLLVPVPVATYNTCSAHN